MRSVASRASIDTLLRAGELAEDAAERVDGLEERADVREACLVQDDRAAHDLRDAGAPHLARRERDVRLRMPRRCACRGCAASATATSASST